METVVKVGLVGVGKWGRTLAKKFVEAGSEIGAHDRASEMAMPDRFGPRVSWAKMLEDDQVSAIVAATPPDVTLEIFHACQQAGKPCFLTKPLFLAEPVRVKTTVGIDYIHLYSHLWSLLGSVLVDDNIASMCAISTGMGPVRSFPGSLDYGPHALSMLLAARNLVTHSTPTSRQTSLIKKTEDGKELLVAEMMMDSQISKIDATLVAGNAVSRTTSFSATTHAKREVLYVERGGVRSLCIDGKVVVEDRNHDPLKKCVEQFLLNAAIGFKPSWAVDMSYEIASILIPARENAIALPDALAAAYGHVTNSH